MEYLYQINPILQQDKPIIIYGIGEGEKNIFFALLQQDIYVTAFCLKQGQESTLKKLFNKKIINFNFLKENYQDAYVVISGKTVDGEDGEELQEAGIKNLVVENITMSQGGILFLGE